MGLDKFGVFGSCGVKGIMLSFIEFIKRQQSISTIVLQLVAPVRSYHLPRFNLSAKVFRNISSLLGCIGCDLRRAYLRHQFFGLGTALRS